MPTDSPDEPFENWEEVHNGSAFAAEVINTRVYHTATLVGKLVFVFGGFTSKGVVNTLHVLDTTINKWRKIRTFGEPPRARNGHSACLVDDKIYFYGGTTALEYLARDLVVYDITMREYQRPRTEGQRPGPATLHTTEYVAARNEILLFAGSDGYECLNDLHALDEHRLCWTKLRPRGEPPTPRANHGSCLIHPNLYIFGGQNSTGTVLNDLHILKLETSVPVWTRPKVYGNIPPALYATQLANVQGKLTLICGMTLCGPSAEVFTFSTYRTHWKKERRLTRTCPKTGKHVAVSAPDKLIILGGVLQKLGTYSQYHFEEIQPTRE